MPLSALIGLGAVLVVIGIAVLGLFVAFTLRRVVPTDMVHIVQSGRKTVSFGKGQAVGNVYYEVPAFVPVWGVTVSKFSISNFKIELKDYSAYDKGRLQFKTDVVAFFQIFDSGVAAERVSSFQELTVQLQEILRGSVRRVLAEHPLEEILGMRSELGKTFTGEVDEQLKEWGVRTVKTIEFMDMRDEPPSTVIHDIMAKDQARISRESRTAIAENQKLAETAEVEAKREVDLRKQDASQQVGQRTAEQEKAVGIAREKSKQDVLEEARTTAERDMAVRQVKDVKGAEIERQVAEVTAAKDKAVSIVSAEAKRETEVIAAEAEKRKKIVTAEGEKQRLELVAEGTLAQSLKDAEGIRAKGEAEGKAKEAINLAEVAPQITLAKEIGENKSYQEYLVNVEQIKANASVGIAQAGALEKADIKVIANGGDVQGGMGNIGAIFSNKGGTALAGWLSAFASTPQGEAVLNRVIGDSKTPPDSNTGPGPAAAGRA